MSDIRVIIWGLGAMGGGMAKLISEKNGMRIVGAIAGRPEKNGKDLGEVIGLGKKLGVEVSNDYEGIIKNTDADVVVLATDSFVKNVFPQIKLIVESGKNCVTIAEEMAYPYTVESELSKEIHALAEKNGVTVLGTGVNPGFVLDTLIVTLTGACRRVDRIRAARINDLSPFGTTVMRTQGVGTTPEQFRKGLENGSIVGHIGFKQSIWMIADALGLEIDEVVETREPIISNTHRETPYVVVEPGMVAGCKHIGYGMRKGEAIITLEHPQQIHPSIENIETGDYIWVEGDPNLNLSIKPETPGGIGTIAVAVNMIPHVINSKPGLVSMNDLPIPRAISGDVSKMVCRNK
jgi:4-hydroxy-tetrahydrodipicolinate reductase